METNPLPDASLEMIKFIGQKNGENNERSQSHQKATARLKKKRNEIVKTLIGVGNALRALTEQKDEIEEELLSLEKENVYQDVNAKFIARFGIPMYSVNQNPKLTQRQIDALKEIDD